MILPRIRRREPLSGFLLQFITYETVSIYYICDVVKRNSSRCDSLIAFKISCIISITRSGTLIHLFLSKETYLEHPK